MPPPKTPTLYDTKKTTIWFAVASILLTVGLVAMVLQDSSRDWKMWQRKFMEYNRQKATAELEQVKQAIDQKQLETLKAQETGFEKELAAHRAELKKIEAELNKLRVEFTKANDRYQTLKQYQDSDRYFFEEHRLHHAEKKAEKYAAKLEKRGPELSQAKLELERLEKARDAKQAELDAMTAGARETEKAIQKLQQDIERIDVKIKKNTYSWDKQILNAPMLDFMNPTLRIQQAVLENLHEDFYYVRVNRVDRCTTCHLGIDQKGYEDAPQPFKSHPKLELFLGSESLHPIEAIGCTTCHGGSGHSVSFVTAAHTPRNDEQAKEWKKKYQWHPMEHWDEKMLPLAHVEAACAKCHQGVREVPEAPKLNEGRRLAEQSGCFACHKVEGVERWKVGPSLTHVQSKLEEDWIVRWLHNPKEFRPETKMPRVFHLSNTSDPESVEKNNAAIASIAAYLMKNSEPIEVKPVSEQGNPDEGKRLIEAVGCLGCHTVGDKAANDHGPVLSALGSKVKKEWLFDWLKNPKHYSAHTRMPDLRLSDQEAIDIASFLLQQRNEKFESIRLPIVKPETIDGMALEFMAGMMRYEEAQTALGQMSANEKLEYLGQKMITRQGCFGCHDIKGFEDAKPIGTELTMEGSKEIDKLDFGFVPIERTREHWFAQKLKEPRIFDQGKVKTYNEKLRMPQFDFTDAEVEALTTFLLSLQDVEIPLEMQKFLSDKDKEIEAGRLMVAQFNCQGCHTMDGKEGRVRSVMEDLGLAPPILHGEGSKVQEPWIHDFLKQPTTIRPWLTYRMPTFGFKDHELTKLILYFNHLSAVQPSFTINEIPSSTPEMLSAGRELFKTFQCIKCHQAEPPKGLSASFLAPNLVMSKERLRPDWILEWLKDPQALMEGTMMPTFFYDGQSPVGDILDGDATKQIRAMRDYLMVFTPEEAKAAQPQAPAPAKTPASATAPQN